jgi:hypothetical protein
MREKPEVPTSSHFTSPEKATPRTGQEVRGGVSRVGWLEPGGVATRPSSRQWRGAVPEDVRRQTSIGLQVLDTGRWPVPALRLCVRRLCASAAT